MKLNKELFEYDICLERAKHIFKETVSNVCIAISSYCNRKCFYCPNIYSNISDSNYPIDNNLFNNIISQLADIQYSGAIQLHRFNEPLANKSHALLKISQIIGTLPDARLLIYTNGDYLDTDLIKTLSNIGVRQIFATLHLNNRNTTYQDLYKQLLIRVHTLGFEFTEIDYDSKSIAIEVNYRNLNLQYLVMNYDFIHDRGGTIDVNYQHTRYEPCLSALSDLQIEFDGSLFPCCNLNSGVDSHRKTILGKLDSRSNIYEEWVNNNYVDWRRKMVTFMEKAEPCSNCIQRIMPDTPENRYLCDLIRQ